MGRNIAASHEFVGRAGFARVLQLSRPFLPLRSERRFAKIAEIRSISEALAGTMT